MGWHSVPRWGLRVSPPGSATPVDLGDFLREYYTITRPKPKKDTPPPKLPFPARPPTQRCQSAAGPGREHPL